MKAAYLNFVILIVGWCVSACVYNCSAETIRCADDSPKCLVKLAEVNWRINSSVVSQVNFLELKALDNHTTAEWTLEPATETDLQGFQVRIYTLSDPIIFYYLEVENVTSLDVFVLTVPRRLNQQFAGIHITPMPSDDLWANTVGKKNIWGSVELEDQDITDIQLLNPDSVQTTGRGIPNMIIENTTGVNPLVATLRSPQVYFPFRSRIVGYLVTFYCEYGDGDGINTVFTGVVEKTFTAMDVIEQEKQPVFPGYYEVYVRPYSNNGTKQCTRPNQPHKPIDCRSARILQPVGNYLCIPHSSSYSMSCVELVPPATAYPSFLWASPHDASSVKYQFDQEFWSDRSLPKGGVFSCLTNVTKVQRCDDLTEMFRETCLNGGVSMLPMPTEMLTGLLAAA